MTNTPQPTFQPPTNTPVPGGDGSPYGGTAAVIPGKVEAENFNTGGEGVAYHDADTTNQGGAYRPNEGVDIEACTDSGCGNDVGWTANGEWMKYTANVQSSGTYNLDFRVASAQSGGTFHLEVDNTNLTGTLTVPNTGGWQTWTTVSKAGVSLNAGQHVLKWATDVGGGNYNWLNISRASSSGDGNPYGGTAAAILGKVEAENFNTGGEGVAYHDTDTVNQGGAYRPNEGVDIEACTDSGCGFDIGWTASGEWLKYTVNVQSSASYYVSFRVASAQSGAAFHLEVDGSNVTGTLSMPNTGAWQNWQTVTKSGVSLSSGQHVLRLYMDNGGGNFNWINFSTTPPPTVTPPPGGWPSHYYAPYIDVSLRSDLVGIASASSSKFFSLAFVIDAGSSCTAEWGGTSNTMSSSFLVSEINSLRSAGGDVIVSFGGAAGNELALDCGSVSSLQDQYQAVINKYNLTHLDFDIEGTALDNTSANDRRNKAIKNLEAANSNLVISYTLPVDTSGLAANGTSLLQNAASNGTRVDIVNIMTMDYANDSRDMGSAATQAATSTESQLAGIFTGHSSAEIWHMIGITPMIGQNDTLPETFTLSNASTVLSFSQQNNTHFIGMWSMNRDHQCGSGVVQPSDTCNGVSQSDYQFSTTWSAFNH